MDKNWTSDISLVLDFETTSLPIGIRRQVIRNSKVRPVTYEWIIENAPAYKNVLPVEMGFTSLLDQNVSESIVFKDIESPGIPESRIDKVFKGSAIIGGERQEVKVIRTIVQNKEDILAALQAKKVSGNKLDKEAIDRYIKYELYNQEQKGYGSLIEVVQNDIRLLVSKFSIKGYMEKTPEELADMIYKKYGIVSEVESFKGIMKEGKSAEFVNYILGKVRNGETVNIGAWNSSFEAGVLSNLFSQYGTPEIKLQYENALKSGKINFIGVEQGWIDIMYAYAKESPEIAKALKIPVSADTFREFGMRVGRNPLTYEEFASALPQSQEFVANLFRGFSDIAKQMEGIEEAHHGLADTNAAVKLDKIFNNIKEKIKEIAASKGYNTDTEFIDFVNKELQQDGTVVTEAIESVLSEDKNYKPILGSIKKDIEAIKDRTIATGQLRGKNIKPLSFKGPGSGSYKIGGILQDSKAMWKYGPIAAGILGVLAATYMSSSSELKEGEGGLDLQQRRGRGKAKYKDIVEDDFISGHALSGIAFPVLGVAAGLYVTGLRDAKLRGHTFGVKDENIDNIFNDAKNIFSTIRRGIRVLESKSVKSRVFKTGSVLDFIFGYQNYDKEYAQGKHKSFKFNTIEEGKILNWEKEVEGSKFFDTMKDIHKDEYDKLINTLSEAKNNPISINKQTIKISIGEKGNAIVSVDTIDNIWDKEIQKHKLETKTVTIETDIIPTIDRTSSVNLSRRDISKEAYKRLSPEEKEAYNRIQNSLVNDYMRKNYFESGRASKKTFEEYVSQFRKPSWASNGLMSFVWDMEKRIRHTLELDHKGISEKMDVLNNYEVDLSHVKNVIGAKGLTGKLAGSQKDMALRWNRYSTIPREMISAANRFLETPFQVFINPATIKGKAKALRESGTPLGRIGAKALEFMERPGLGLNLDAMKYGAPQWLLEFGLKRIAPAMGLYYGFNILDKVLGVATFSDGEKGPLKKIPMKMWEGASLLYSKISDITGLTNISKKQEQVAPGSTGLGFFAFPASMASLYGIGSYLYRRSPENFKDLNSKISQYIKTGRPVEGLGGARRSIAESLYKNTIVRNSLRKEMIPGMFKTKTERLFSWGIQNPKKAIFALAMLPMLPFLPGLLGSNKTYEERKAEYAGTKDVPIRKDRFWLLSSQAFQGGKVSQYRRHALNLIESDWENQGVIWPSYGQKMLHKATFGLYDRYMLEKYHAQSQPVEETAPYAANLPLIGPILSPIIGGIVKPRLSREELIGEPADRILPESTVPGGRGGQAVAARYITAANRVESSNVAYGKSQLLSEELASEHDITAHASNMLKTLSDVTGFKGFALESTVGALTGQTQIDQFTQYKQSARQFYNPSMMISQYQAGDVSIIGGELIRRVFNNQDKRWTVNNLKNELYGQDWIPKRYQSGTTFDKMPMGWLYASKKGWEYLYPDTKGVPLDQYNDITKTQILQSIAPSSKEFFDTSKKALEFSLSNQVSPYKEQQLYNAIEQANILRRTIYAHSANSYYALETEQQRGTVTSVDYDSMTFTVDRFGERKFRIAGATSDENQIRAELLKKKKYQNTERLAEDAQRIRSDILTSLDTKLHVGSDIKFNIPTAGSFSGTRETEAIVSGLNKELIAKGSPLIDTGNLSSYNMFQDQLPIGSSLMGKYWEALSSHDTFATKKLLADRDYLENYTVNQVYNREVKLWNKPLEHFIKPLASSILHNLGFDSIPGFTKRRRELQQYWDVIKYIKYKTSAELSKEEGNQAEYEYYNKLSQETMVGANPVDENMSDDIKALPSNERKYFDFFANEPDPKKREKILKYIPEASKRIYKGLWTKKQVESGNADQETIDRYKMLEASGGYDVSDEDYDRYMSETGGNTDLAEYMRARFVKTYADKYDIPGPTWSGWSRSVDIDNVELISLNELGEQVQDYGYFDTKIRKASLDKMAYISAKSIDSTIMRNNQFNGTMLPYLTSSSSLGYSSGMPTRSGNPIASNVVRTDQRDREIYKENHIPSYASAIHNGFLSLLTGGF